MNATINNDFDEVSHYKILELLEHDLTYADLKKFAVDKQDTSYLEVVEIKFENYSLYSVMINRVYVMENQRFNNTLFYNFVYKLDELRNYFKQQKEEEEEEEEEEQEEIQVNKTVINGKNYLIDDDNVIYDFEEYIRIGIWNKETQTIDEDEEE
jgi:hypothetical protein